MIRGTRRPGGAGRRSSGRKMRRGGKSSKGCLVLALAGSALMLASGVAGLALALVPG